MADVIWAIGEEPDQDQTHDTNNHYKASNRVLSASGAKVPVVTLVVPESNRTLFGKRGWTASLAELPCFPAIAPSSDFGSGNEVIVAWHESVLYWVSTATSSE